MATKLQKFPYMPTNPEWKQVPFAEAAAINPNATGFVGWRDQDGKREFHFQIRGVKQTVVVTKG